MSRDLPYRMTLKANKVDIWLLLLKSYIAIFIIAAPLAEPRGSMDLTLLRLSVSTSVDILSQPEAESLSQKTVPSCLSCRSHLGEISHLFLLLPS